MSVFDQASAVMAQAATEIDRLRAENLRFRTGLELIAAHGDKTLIAPSMGEDFDKGHQVGANKAFNQMAGFAEAALGDAA